MIVKGTMDPNKLVEYLHKNTKKHVEIVPQKKDEKKDNKKEGDKKEGGQKGGEKKDGGEEKKDGENKKGGLVKTRSVKERKLKSLFLDMPLGMFILLSFSVMKTQMLALSCKHVVLGRSHSLGS